MPLPAPARAVVMLALAWALTGCGQAIRVGPHRFLNLALTEYRLTPDTVRAYAGTLTISVRNLGTRTHNLVVSLGNRSEGQTKPLRPGAKASFTVDLPTGHYMLRSTILQDQALGLWGTLDVGPT